jgi:DnaJ homolog subfamily C member 28
MPSLIDEIIREAMKKGEFKNLPGQGEPLKIDYDPNTPEHLRVAHKLMKDNNLAPDWIDEGKGLDEEREKLRESLRRAAQ